MRCLASVRFVVVLAITIGGTVTADHDAGRDSCRDTEALFAPGRLAERTVPTTNNSGTESPAACSRVSDIGVGGASWWLGVDWWR